MNTYVARATREGRWWVVDVEGVGVTQARSLAEVEEMASDLIAAVREEDDPTVEVVPVLPERLQREVERARKDTTAATLAQERAAARLREVAGMLVASGLSGRDAGVVLGVSTQRVSQLAPVRKVRAVAVAKASKTVRKRADGQLTKSAQRRRASL